MKPETSNVNEQEYPYWNRVYFAVVITTIIVIAAMWLFSKAFE